MIRLFAALSLPADVALALAGAQDGIRGARWRSRESLHITLRFFGDIAEDRAADVDAALGAVAAPAFTLALQGVGCFGDGGGVEAVWAGVAGSQALSRLARSCETVARRCDLKPETRRFQPHVTLAYLRRTGAAEVASWIQGRNLFRSKPFAVDTFGLYSSWRGQDGSYYRLERSYALSRPL
jgi:2'-5' RNA ligase